MVSLLPQSGLFSLHYTRKRRELDRYAQLLFEIILTDDGRLLRCSRLIRDSIEFNDRPATELNFLHCGEHRRKINPAATKFNELERIFCLRCIGRNIVHVLKVKEEKTVMILFNGLCGVATARNDMGSVQLKLHVFRIRLFEDEIQICRSLAESVQVVVIAKRDANIRSSF